MKSLINRLHAAYIVWELLQLILFVVSGGGWRKDRWFPLDGDIDCYNIWEFILYTIIPIGMY